MVWLGWKAVMVLIGAVMLGGIILSSTYDLFFALFGALAAPAWLFVPLVFTPAINAWIAGCPVDAAQRAQQERYGDHAGYVAAVKKASARAMAEGFLLEPDAQALIRAAEASQVLR
jgi:hypothetical protein